jgi:hypothetical protein
MAPILAELEALTPRERLENVRPRQAKADLKNLEPWREQVGGAIQRALSLAGLTQKEGWVLLGHNDGARLNRWIAGSERPQFDALFAVERLRPALVIALSELAGEDVTINTVVTIRRKVVA